MRPYARLRAHRVRLVAVPIAYAWLRAHRDAGR